MLPGVLNFFLRKEELKNAATMAEIDIKVMELRAKQEMDIIDVRADAAEGDSLRRHDSNLDGKGFIGALRASVRPIITYLFFFLFVAVKLIAVWAFVNTSGNGDWLADSIAWTDIYPIIWDVNTHGIFGAIMGFWFGSRTIEKLKGYYKS